VELNARFVTGDIFNLDGGHPTTVGYGVVANELIKAINAAYGSNISEVNLVELLNATGPGVAAKSAAICHRPTRSKWRRKVLTMSPR